MKKIFLAAGAAAWAACPLHAQVVQTEPNDSFGTATPSTLTAGGSGGILTIGNNGDGPYGPTSGDGTGDFDFFSIEANRAQTIVVDIRANILGSGLDTVIGLYNSSGTLVASNDDDGSSRDSFIRYTTPSTGTYYAVIGNWVRGAGSDADSLPSNPRTPGTGRGAPGGAVGEYEAVILLDGAVYLNHTVPSFPLSEPDESVTASLRLTNEGLSVATITALNITGPGAAAYSVSQSLPLTIASGSARDITITFDPAGSDKLQEATLEIVSDDVVRNTLEIPLSNRAIAGLVLRLPFDDPPGTPTNSFAAPLDTSGNGFNAAYVVNSGAPPHGFGQPPLAGNEGTSVRFNDVSSSGNYVLTANGFPHTATVTYSLWVRPTAGAGVDTLFNRDPNWAMGDAIFGCSISPDGTLNFRIAGQEVVASEPGAVPDDATRHIVVTHLDRSGFGDGQADRTRLYIDGELVSENTDTVEFPQYTGGGSNSRLWIATRSAAGTGFNGDMDDFQLYNIELSPDEVAALYTFPGTALGEGPRNTFRLSREDSNLVFSWDSLDGKLYNLRSTTDPAATTPESWPIFGEHTELEATPPENTLTIPLPDDASRLFVIEEFDAPPETIFFEDFESGQGEWTVGSTGEPGTAWELGTPSNVGPPAANSPTNCFGTNLTSNYDVSAAIWLRSPEIDLSTASAATLHYFHFTDIEAGFDQGEVAVLDAADDSELAIIHSPVDGTPAGWKEVSKSLPEEALGRTVRFEFRFTSDDLENFAGWYLDDISVTIP